MHSFFVFLFFLILVFHSVSSVRMPLLDLLRAPLLVDIDISHMNHKLKGYIDNGIEKQVNETWYRKIENVATHRHMELKSKMQDDMTHTKNKYDLEFSSLALDFKLQFKRLVQNLKNENEVFKKQLEGKNKEKSDELKSESDKHYSDIESKFKQLEQNSKRETEAFKTQVEKMHKDSNGNLKNEIMKLNTKVMSGQKRVALTACITDGTKRSSGYVWKFDDVRTQTGINNLTSFKSTGKFTCESDGLYLVSACIMSGSQYSRFYIYKNGNMIVNTYITSNNRDEWYTGTGVVAVELQVHDTVWVSPGTSVYAFPGPYSCLTIVKIK